MGIVIRVIRQPRLSNRQWRVAHDRRELPGICLTGAANGINARYTLHAPPLIDPSFGHLRGRNLRGPGHQFGQLMRRNAADLDLGQHAKARCVMNRAPSALRNIQSSGQRDMSCESCEKQRCTYKAMVWSDNNSNCHHSATKRWAVRTDDSAYFLLRKTERRQPGA